jgi:hypothetical protein
VAFLKFSEWHNAVKAGIAVCTTFAAVIGIYIGVDAWAEDKITASEQRQMEQRIEAQVRNEIDHDKIVQSSRISRSELHITVTEMKLEQLEEDIDERVEDGKDPTARQERSMERLTRLLETYETEQIDATTKLTKITTTTTTTTTTETE